MPLPYPHEERPVLQQSLRQFVACAGSCVLDDELLDMPKFLKLVLARRLQVNGMEHYIFLNAQQGLQPVT